MNSKQGTHGAKRQSKRTGIYVFGDRRIKFEAAAQIIEAMHKLQKPNRLLLRQPFFSSLKTGPASACVCFACCTMHFGVSLHSCGVPITQLDRCPATIPESCKIIAKVTPLRLESPTRGIGGQVCTFGAFEFQDLAVSRSHSKFGKRSRRLDLSSLSQNKSRCLAELAYGSN